MPRTQSPAARLFKAYALMMTMMMLLLMMMMKMMTMMLVMMMMTVSMFSTITIENGFIQTAKEVHLWTLDCLLQILSNRPDEILREVLKCKHSAMLKDHLFRKLINPFKNDCDL